MFVAEHSPPEPLSWIDVTAGHEYGAPDHCRSSDPPTMSALRERSAGDRSICCKLCSGHRVRRAEFTSSNLMNGLEGSIVLDFVS
jgi:hypothetical protein